MRSTNPTSPSNTDETNKLRQVAGALTRDNLLLSGPKNGLPAECRAINCTTSNSEQVDYYIQQSVAPNTRSAYLSDLAHFERWGGVVPSSPETLARYLAEHANVLSVATLTRRLAALSKIHRASNFRNPASAEIVKSTLAGLKRVNNQSQRQALALVKEDLFAVLDETNTAAKAIRDRALLLIGFAGGFRRSELVGLNFEDVTPVRQGVVILLRRSKTDQIGAGRKIGIPYGRSRWCPIEALVRWKSISRNHSGAIFVSVDRHSRIGTKRLSGEAVCLIIRERLKAAGIDPRGYSGHSLRAGLATSAALAGMPPWKIRQQTGHSSDAMLQRYIRDGELFSNNVAAALL